MITENDATIIVMKRVSSLDPEELAAFVAKGQRMRERFDQIAKGIGHVVISFNRLEGDLSEALGKLLARQSSRTVWDAIRGSLSFSQRIDLLAAIFVESERTADELALLRYCIGKMRRYEDRRNAIVHSTWGTELLGQEEIRSRKVSTKGAKGVRVNIEPADEIGLMALAEEIDAFSGLDFVELYRACLGEPITWVKPVLEDFAPRMRARAERRLREGR